MSRCFPLILFVSLPWVVSAAPERLYVNDQKAPESRRDLETIQKALISALPKARESTVCIDLGSAPFVALLLTTTTRGRMV